MHNLLGFVQAFIICFFLFIWRHLYKIFMLFSAVGKECVFSNPFGIMNHNHVKKYRISGYLMG